MERTFSKNVTLASKGLALIFLYCHHLFYMIDRSFVVKIGEKTFKLFSFSKYEKFLYMCLSEIGYVCLFIFLFLSTYGLTISLRKWKEKQKSFFFFILDRYVALISGLIFVFILATVSGVFFGNDLITKYGIVKGIVFIPINAFGMSAFFKTPTLNGTWWYFSLATTAIVMLPVFDWFYEKFGAASILISFFTIIILNGIKGFPIYINFLFICPMAVCASKNNFFEKAYNIKFFKNSIINRSFHFVILSISIIVLVGSIIFSVIDGIPEFIKFSFLSIFIVLFVFEFLYRVPVISHILIFIGKHSANLFMIHTFFYAYYFSSFYYSFRHPVLILLVLLITTIPVSMLIQFLKKITRYNDLVQIIRKKISDYAEKKTYQQMQIEKDSSLVLKG